MAVIRHPDNPIIRTCDVKPSRPDFEVLGVFNAGVAVCGEETILLLRVAEAPVKHTDGEIRIPLLRENGGQVVVERLSLGDGRYDFSDSRFVSEDGQIVMLTSMSHLRVARSRDGVHFAVDEIPALYPMYAMEAWGIEDPRITQIGDQYYITYSAASSRGVAVGLARTADFKTIHRLSIMLAPENKDAALFPEKIGDKFFALHRPVPHSFGAPEMWIAESPDLLHWGNHRYLLGLRPGYWDGSRIGGGAVPIRTDDGWLVLYHGADAANRYCMGAVLLDLHNPGTVIARSSRPYLEPVAEYEVNGFFGKVVFSCGALLVSDTIRMYYGAADEVMALADIPLQDIFDTMVYE
jgi:predicted GH43/DUF377 family glycosyl hydrolase